MGLKNVTQKRSYVRIRGRRIGKGLRLAACSILIGSAALFIAAIAPHHDHVSRICSEDTAYAMTAEYQENLRQDFDSEEAEELQRSVEAYRGKQQRIAEEQFREQFLTDHEDTMGFIYYEIPDAYVNAGGNFPEKIQRFLLDICIENGFDYPTAVAVIEQESNYQQGVTGEASDGGYFQVVPKYHIHRMKRLKAFDMTNPYDNTLVAIDYLCELLAEYDGDYGKVLTAYNCGPEGAYRKFFSAGVTESPYAKQVLARAERIREELENAAED